MILIIILKMNGLIILKMENWIMKIFTLNLDLTIVLKDLIENLKACQIWKNFAKEKFYRYYNR